jgi:hypothetical protein
MRGIRRKVVSKQDRTESMGGWHIRVTVDVLECGHELPSVPTATHRACRECAATEREG